MMEEILQRYETSIAWANAARQITEEQWLSPMKDGKWSIAETVSHLIAWDRFILDVRLPHIAPGKQLASAPVDVETMNGDAARYARSGVTRDELLDQWVDVRSRLLDKLRTHSEESFAAPYYIGDREMTLARYIEGMIDHDLHHREQMDAFLGR
ncbi:DinB family protein [Brevibacillus fluminis]|uniref:DinB family protein n=1 Tax=Brevibacillus fluminis TaxID=511487 RepID=UPI003F8B1126